MERSRRHPIARYETGAFLGLLLAVLLAGSAGAQNLVYNSPNDDGTNPQITQPLEIGPNEALFLYIDTGFGSTTIGEPCASEAADGRELCGYSITIDTLGGASFVDFDPEPNVVFQSGIDRLVINGSFALNPASTPARIGELVVSSSQEGSGVRIESGEAVIANLRVEPIVQTIVAATAVPEPGAVSGLLIGSLGLVLGAAARARR